MQNINNGLSILLKILIMVPLKLAQFEAFRFIVFDMPRTFYINYVSNHKGSQKNLTKFLYTS